MSKHDFPAEEFAARHTRARRAVGAAGLDWLLVIHPMSLHWLIGTEAKSYQTFQCLLLSAKPDLLVMFTRLSERCELVEDSLADEVIGWGGPEPEDPLEAFLVLVEVWPSPCPRWSRDATVLSASTSAREIEGSARYRAGRRAVQSDP